MKLKGKEKRRYQRYDTQTEILFQIKYDLNTKVSFKLLKPKSESIKKYKGITKDVSVEGLRFSSVKKLHEGDILDLELYLPRQKKPIHMTGEVRWSKKILPKPPEDLIYDTGVQLITIEGKKVAEIIYFDQKYGVYWSLFLDSIFGNFKKLVKKIRTKNPESLRGFL